MTIPNILSIFRIILIPIFTYEFLAESDYTLAGIILIISGLTDCLDGYIARRFNMITDLGKVLDPVADKLTQFMSALCLALKDFDIMWFVLAFLLIKDIALIIGGITIYKKKDLVVSSNWYGKAATIIFYVAVILVALLYPNISDLFKNIVGGLLILAGAMAFGGYISYFFSIKSKKIR